jgi:hypothetical protein
MLHTRTTVGVYRLTYVDVLCTTNSVYAQLMLLSDRCTKYSILTGIIIDIFTLCATDALRTVCVAAYSTTVHLVTHLMLLPYNLCGTVIQLMLLGYDHTTCIVRSVTYDIMSLLGTYVRLCAVAGHNLLLET